MSDPVQIAIIGAMSVGIPSIMSAYFAYRATVASKATLAVAQQTEKNTNHLKDELVAVTHAAALAEGKLQGKQEARNESTK